VCLRSQCCEYYKVLLTSDGVPELRKVNLLMLTPSVRSVMNYPEKLTNGIKTKQG
jgi:hypothetical protein